MKEICPICGSKEIVLLDIMSQKYSCKSCDNTFSLTDKPTYIVRKEKVQPNDKTLSIKEIYKKNIESVFEINCMFGDESACGTCFYISEEGYLLSNAHVVINVDKKGKPRLCDGAYFCKSHSTNYDELKIMYIDAKNDLVLLKSNQTVEKFVSFAKDEVEIGDGVCAVGNSKGAGLALVDGIVSDLNREFMGRPAFLFSALVTNGCSGGPIFNDKGELCGVTVGQVKDAAGMNYGIPLPIIKDFIKRAEKDKEIKIINL